jgi:hypothetical protein
MCIGEEITPSNKRREKMISPHIENGKRIGVEEQLAELDGMSVGQLHERYLELFGQESRSRNKAFLQKKLAWRIQELAEGGLSEQAKKRLAALEKNVPAMEPQPAPTPAAKAEPRVTDKGVKQEPRDPRLPESGAVLTRCHKGETHSVKVLEDGFEYDGRQFRTLSAVARFITHIQWNGFLFFQRSLRAHANTADKQ